MPKVLIHFTHGLGDAVQLTSVLQHLQKYRPDWELHLQALRGKESVDRGYCTRVWHDQVPGRSCASATPGSDGLGHGTPTHRSQS
jgi:hypothetical protein